MVFFYLLIAVMPIVRHAIWSETQIAGMTAYKLLGIVCLVVAVNESQARRTPHRFFAEPQSWLFFLFTFEITLSFFSMARSIDPEGSVVSSFSAFLMFFFTAITLINTAERLRWTLLSMVGGLAYTSLHLIREWQAYGGMTERPYWVVGDPNYFTLGAIFGLPIAVLLAQEKGHYVPWWQRRFCLGCLVLILFAVTLAASRGGVLGLAVTGAILAWHSRNRWRNYFAGALVLLLVMMISPTSPLRRFINPAQADQVSTDTREALFWAGLDIFRNNVLIGIGAGNFKAEVAGYGLENVAHNTYVEVGAELGIFGLLTFAAIIVCSIKTVARIRSITRSEKDSLIYLTANGLQSGLLGGAVAIVFLSALHVRALWFTVILTMCLASLLHDAKARSRVAARPKSLRTVSANPVAANT